MNNLYVFTGDRFACLKENEKVLQSLVKDWSIIFHEDITYSKFYLEYNSRDIFGTKNKAFILDNIKIEDQKGFAKIISNVPRDRVLIFIFEEKSKIEKKGEFFENILKISKDFPKAHSDSGFLNNKNIKFIKEYLKDLLKFTTKDDVVDYILEKCDYEYGAFFEEFEKIRTFLGRDPKNIEEIESVVVKNTDILYEDIINSFKDKDKLEYLNNIQDLVDTEIYKDHYMAFFGSLMENFRFMSFCKMAEEQNVGNIAEYVSDRYSEIGQKKNPQSINARFFYSKKYLTKWNLNQILEVLRSSEIAIKDSMFEKRTPRNILEGHSYLI